MLNPGLDLLIKATRDTQGDGIAAYIAFMAERMFEIKRVLKPTGSVYLHCDHEAEAYLRQMMDAVFGTGNFRTAIPLAPPQLKAERIPARSQVVGQHAGYYSVLCQVEVRRPQAMA